MEEPHWKWGAESSLGGKQGRRQKSKEIRGNRGGGGHRREKKGRNLEMEEQRWKEKIYGCKEDHTGSSQEEFKF